MIGAIIGDLAAWTYENDKDTFWKQLISEDCEKIELSVYVMPTSELQAEMSLMFLARM